MVFFHPEFDLNIFKNNNSIKNIKSINHIMNMNITKYIRSNSGNTIIVAIPIEKKAVKLHSIYAAWRLEKPLTISR